MPSPAETIEIDGIAVKVTSGDRLVFPAAGSGRPVTKREVVAYYAAMADRLLPELRNRPTTLERYPDGPFPGGGHVPGKSFTMKHLPERGRPEWVHGVEVVYPSGRRGVQLLPDHAAVLAWAVQMGTITFHPWPVTAPEVDHPDTLRLDFDPSGNATFADAVEAAQAARALLAEWSWPAWCKTSGGRGIHIHVPIEPRWDVIDVRHAAIAIGRELERRMPERITTSWWREQRGDRVFVDFNQAARDRTMASAYSIRANRDATVSMPVDWSDLAAVSPRDFTIRTVTARGDDPWAGWQVSRVGLEPALARWEEDLEEGLGELPYPPDFPKMPGEPPRVPPSRARRH